MGIKVYGSLRRFYESEEWKRISRTLRAENPVCEWCNRAPSEQVHHRVPIRLGGHPTARSNLVVVCQPCHKAAEAEAALLIVER